MYYEKERSLFGDKAECEEKLGGAYFELNKMSEAEREYLKLIKTDTANGIAYFRLAIIDLKKGTLKPPINSACWGREMQAETPTCIFRSARAIWMPACPIRPPGSMKKACGFPAKTSKHGGNLPPLIQVQKDNAAAEACLKVFEFDNNQFKDYLVKAAELNGHMGRSEKAKGLYNEFLDLGFVSQSVTAELSKIEFLNKNYKRVIELQKIWRKKPPWNCLSCLRNRIARPDNSTRPCPVARARLHKALITEWRWN